jgi:trimeric autotransporter adhesin
MNTSSVALSAPPLLRGFWTTWLRALLALVLLSLVALQSAQAAPSAGTVIGNQATATYLDGTGTSRSTSSNLVQTTVSQVKSFTLTADGAKAAAPGQTVYYPHTLTNTGNGTDTYALTAPTSGGAFTHTTLTYYVDANGDGVPDNFTPITSSGPLPQGGVFNFVVAGVVPAATATGATGTIVVGASDTGGNSATNTDTTTVANSVINVTKALSAVTGASPSAAPITVTLSYTNSGTATATNLVLTDALPTGMSYVVNSGRWSVSGATVLTDAAGGDPAGISYAQTGTTVTATVASIGAGVSGILSFQVNIASGLAPTVPTNAAVTTNTATFATATQATANTNSATYSVLKVAGVTASGTTVASAPQGGTVSFNNTITNTGNGADSFEITVPATGTAGNTFPAGTTFALYRADGTTSLLDTNGSGTPDTGPLAAGASFVVVLKATLPAGATGGPFSLGKVATSAFDSTKTATATDTLTSIVASSMDLTLATARTDSTPAGTAAAGNAGTTGFGPGTATTLLTTPVTPSAVSPTTTAFRLVLNNTSAAADSYDLSLTSALPTGWAVSFYADAGGNCATLGTALVNSGPIAAGANTAVCAVVTVPAANSGNAAPGTSPFTFQARSPVNPTSVDTLVTAVQVLALHNVTLTPNGTQQTLPGGSVTYAHTLRNGGNAVEAISFATGFLTDSQAAAGWTSAAYLDSNGNGVLDVGTDVLITTATTLNLPANNTQTVFVRVFAPASATSSSPADVTTLTVTYNAGASTVSANDTTSVTNGLLLSKTQVAGTCGTALIAGPFSSAAIVASVATQPGKCVAYQITAANTAASPITNVVLSDLVPANTTLASTSCAAPAATAGAVIGGVSAEGATGAVTATLASLAPTASFQLTFCVRINP